MQTKIRKSLCLDDKHFYILNINWSQMKNGTRNNSDGKGETLWHYKIRK